MKNKKYMKPLIFLWALAVISTYSLVPAGVIKHNENLSRLGVLGFAATLPLGLKFCSLPEGTNKNDKQRNIKTTKERE